MKAQVQKVTRRLYRAQTTKQTNKNMKIFTSTYKTRIKPIMTYMARGTVRHVKTGDNITKDDRKNLDR